MLYGLHLKSLLHFLKWPGVSPHVPEGAAHQKDAKVGVNNEQDEGEHEA
jgi:hypothetical protein